MDHAQHFTFGSCAARLDGGILTVGNALFSRVWRVDEAGLLYPLEFVAGAVSWFAAGADLAAPSPPVAIPPEVRTVTLKRSAAAPPVQTPGLLIDIVAEGNTMTIGYRIELFEAIAGVSMRLWFRRHASQAATATEVDRFPSLDLMERFDAAAAHLRLTAVEMRDCSDDINELVFARQWLLQTNEKDLALAGNLFALEDTLRGTGLVFLKEAPLPPARSAPCRHDALFFGKGFASAFYGHGFDADDPATITQDRDVPAEEEMGYRWTLLAYQDGSPGRTMALHAYQRLRRTYEPSRDGMLLSNTWGDRSQDARMCQEFMLREISAGACLGADVVQLDDGWQAGVTSNSVTAGGAWEGFWARGSFWTVHPQRFPQSLAPLVEAAATQSLRLGLWYAPDSADDIGNWQRDAQAILALHRRWGINYFKIDSISIRSKTAERNLQRLVAAIQADSGGRVVLDIDITAGKRGGYWFLLHAGPLFVENRYTDRRGYWPHQTLRNLWKLAHWVDPLRLRMEFLNPTRNQALYAADPLAPGAYSPQYLFATVMGCSPLGWFEMSHLPASFVSEVAKLVAIWKKHREAYFRGVILPIGAEPDGTSWTGFASITPDRHSAYLLLFREFNNRPNWEVELPLLIPGRYTATILAGTGDVNLANGRLRAGIPEPRGFLLVQVDRQ